MIKFSWRRRHAISAVMLFGLVAVVQTQAPANERRGTSRVTAIVGATVIDGNGGQPLVDGTVVIDGDQITMVGSRQSVKVPADANVIDGTGKYVLPGLIDTNVHLGPIGGETTFARYWDRLEDIILQSAQLHLKYGVTTVRDSYGPLMPLKAIRDAIEHGSEIGPRMYVAGNIVGWGGPFTSTFSRTHETGINFFQEQINDLFTHGSGEEMLHMTADEVRTAINKYLDQGPDFIKYGGTEHNEYPTLISFSPRAQKVIVDETHKRGLFAETHSTTLEGLDVSIEAGLDVIQHPEVVGFREITDELVNLIIEHKIICSMLPNKYTGKLWQDAVKERDQKTAATTEKDQADRPQRLIPRTPTEIRRQTAQSGVQQEGTLLIPNLEMRRANARKLIQRGAIISVGADSVVGEAPEFRRTQKPPHLDPGNGTLVAIEGLVEMGMTPSQAIVAATKNGAMACKALQRFGTLERGKIADVLVVTADPLVNISNLRKVELVLKQGRVVDLRGLPTRRPYGDWSKSPSLRSTK